MLKYRVYGPYGIEPPRAYSRPAIATPRLLDRDDPEKVVKAEAKRLRKKAKRLEVVKRAEFRKKIKSLVRASLKATRAMRSFGVSIDMTPLAAAASAHGRARAIASRHYVAKTTPPKEDDDAS